MRISTNMLYSHGTTEFQNRASEMLQLQQQVSTGRRVVSPSDDPIAAASSLVVSQAKAVNTQYETNRAEAKTALNTVDSVLAGVGDLMAYVKEKVIQSGNGSLGPQDLTAIATDLKARFESLMGFANTRDGSGGFLFAGYQTDTQPFVGNATAGVVYTGDQGARMLQISDTRIIPVSNAGDDIFMKVPNSNGAFNTATTGSNTGTGVISDGQVTGAYNGHNYSIQFTSATTYDVVDTTAAASVVTGATYTPGAQIAFGGIQMTVAGAPATGDSFSVAAGGYTDVFKSLKTFIDSLSVVSGSALNTFVGEAINHTDSALDNVLRVRASVGSRVNESTALDNVGAAADLQYAETISRLTDLDYASAISSLTQKQTALTAAQQAFIKTTNLSLFNYLG